MFDLDHLLVRTFLSIELKLFNLLLLLGLFFSDRSSVFPPVYVERGREEKMNVESIPTFT